MDQSRSSRMMRLFLLVDASPGHLEGLFPSPRTPPNSTTLERGKGAQQTGWVPTPLQIS